MPNITPKNLHTLVRDILLAAGADERNADRVAEALVSSNHSGVDTHGVFHLPRYVDEMKNGTLVPTAWPEIIRETPTTALVSGNWTFGHVVARYALDVALRKAGEQGVSVVSFVRSLHIGRLGEYAEIAASRGMIAQVWASGYSEEEPVAVPYGGRSRVLHTNPVSMGFPGDGESSMVFDFATTTVAGSKAALATQRGQDLPMAALADADGNATSDPTVLATGGGHLPFGAHKGYAIMLANELLGRVLSGSDDYAEDNRGGPVMRHQGVTIIALKADLFRPLTDFATRADEYQDRMRAVLPAPGFDEVIVPGDPEKRARAERSRDGVPVPDDVWQSLVDVAEALGVAFPQ